jgi:hypothetical protein
MERVDACFGKISSLADEMIRNSGRIKTALCQIPDGWNQTLNEAIVVIVD